MPIVRQFSPTSGVLAVSDERISVAVAALFGAGGCGGARVVGGGRPPRAVNRPVVGLGTGVDFSLLASACRGHLVGVCVCMA